MIKFYLAKLLSERVISQAELSRKTGIRPGTINAYYHGYIKRMNVDDLNKMCKVLGCKLHEIVKYVPDKK